jgi:hypothetical protein
MLALLAISEAVPVGRNLAVFTRLSLGSSAPREVSLALVCRGRNVTRSSLLLYSTSGRDILLGYTLESPTE